MRVLARDRERERVVWEINQIPAVGLTFKMKMRIWIFKILSFLQKMNH